MTVELADDSKEIQSIQQEIDQMQLPANDDNTFTRERIIKLE